MEKNTTTLAEIQAKLKAPKGQRNNFGNYSYRSCEDILEALKPIINPLGFWVTLNDEIVQVGDRYYVKATATITNGKDSWSNTAFAREEESKKGMDGSQVTGASSSYARKFALNGLLSLDDAKDSDATNTHGKEDIKPTITAEAKAEAKKQCDMPTFEKMTNAAKMAADSKGKQAVLERAFSAYKLSDEQTALLKSLCQ
jgi:hypothetical protein